MRFCLDRRGQHPHRGRAVGQAEARGRHRQGGVGEVGSPSLRANGRANARLVCEATMGPLKRKNGLLPPSLVELRRTRSVLLAISVTTNTVAAPTIIGSSAVTGCLQEW